MQLFRLGLLLLPLGMSGLAACSILNAPDDIVPPGSGGSGGSGGGSPTTSSSGGAGGMAQGGGGTGGAGGAQPAVCGNGALETDEECDDGNLDAGDACSAMCRRVVFDIVAAPGVQSDGPQVGRSGADGGSGFLVVWREDDGAGNIAVKGSTYRANGIVEGAPVTISTTPGPRRPQMGTNPAGASLVAWQSDATGENGSVRVRTVGPNGSAGGAGDTLIPSSQATVMSNVAAKSGGEFCLLWTAGSPITVRARCLDTQGAITFTQTQDLGPTNGAGRPGIWSAGNLFVGAWPQADGSLRGLALDAAGTPQSQLFLIPSNGSQNLNPAGVSVGNTDGHVVVFEQVFGMGAGAFTRLTKRDFQMLGTSAELDSFVSTLTDHDEKDAAIAWANGKYVVAWADNDVNFGDILAQVFDAAGDAIGDPIQVNKLAPGGTQRLVEVAVNEGGDAFFVWESEQSGSRKVSGLVHPRLLPP